MRSRSASTNCRRSSCTSTPRRIAKPSSMTCLKPTLLRELRSSFIGSSISIEQLWPFLPKTKRYCAYVQISTRYKLLILFLMAKSKPTLLSPKTDVIGRPPGQPLDPESAQRLTWSEIDVDDRWRIRLAPTQTVEVDWLAEDKSQDVLVVMRESGVFQICPWSPDGDAVITKRRELIADSASNQEAANALIDLDLKYVRLTLGKDNRVTLSPEVLLHMDISEMHNRKLLLLAGWGRIAIWTKLAREAHMRVPHEFIQHLAR